VWHLHILDTKAYQACMDQIPGNKFIHHDPVNALDQEARKGRAERWVGVARAYYQDQNIYAAGYRHQGSVQNRVIVECEPFPDREAISLSEAM
jgi:hypothetical protein